MTKDEWQVATDPKPMLRFLKGKASDRKLRLLACACCRHAWSSAPDALPQEVCDAEEFADGHRIWAELTRPAAGGAEEDELTRTTRRAAQSVLRRVAHAAAVEAAEYAAHYRRELETAAHSSSATVEPWTSDPRLRLRRARATAEALSESMEAGVAARNMERAIQASLIRDVFNPFCSLTADPVWRTSTVAALAAQMYESRDFSAMPILADALQDTGCENTAILDHCRASGPHFRGCWLVDLLLAKE